MGSFQLLMPIGAGGMGRVWVARRLNSPTQQFVAVKTVLDELAGDVEFERVFVDEARIASSIVHPNVCTIYEMGVERSIPYLVMEWVNGGSLHDILTASEDHRISYFTAARVVASVCAGLHAAHELTDLDGTPMNVVHRDVSPQNILISEHGHVKIVDFGVARAKGQLHKPTETGELKGKLSYMAPEQLTTKQFDRRADVFALGCVLFQATTGQRPFHGNDALETMYKLLETDSELPSTLCPDYPPELETIVLKALSKNVETRYRTAEAFEQDLEHFLTRHGTLITDRELAGLVAHNLGPIVSRRTKALQSAVEGALHAQSTVRPGAGHQSSTQQATNATSTPSPAPLIESNVVSGSERSSSLSTTPRAAWESVQPRPKSARAASLFRIWLPVSVGVLLLFGGGWLGWLRVQKAEHRTTTVRTTSPIATPIESIEVRLTAVPPEATLQIDNDTKTQGVFVPTPKRSLSPPQRPSPPTKAVSSVGSTATSSATPTNSTLGKNRKPKRPLDPTNPFTEP